MPSICKTLKHEHLLEILAIIIVLYPADKLYKQIGAQLNLAKSSVTIIISQYNH